MDRHKQQIHIAIKLILTFLISLVINIILGIIALQWTGDPTGVMENSFWVVGLVFILLSLPDIIAYIRNYRKWERIAKKEKERVRPAKTSNTENLEQKEMVSCQAEENLEADKPSAASPKITIVIPSSDCSHLCKEEVREGIVDDENPPAPLPRNMIEVASEENPDLCFAELRDQERRQWIGEKSAKDFYDSLDLRHGDLLAGVYHKGKDILLTQYSYASSILTRGGDEVAYIVWSRGKTYSVTDIFEFKNDTPFPDQLIKEMIHFYDHYKYKVEKEILRGYEEKYQTPINNFMEFYCEQILKR